MQAAEVLHEELVNLVILRLRAECDLRCRQRSVFGPLKYADPEGLLKKHGQCDCSNPHDNPSLHDCDGQGTDNPEGQVT